jgi:hypothetical protein
MLLSECNVNSSLSGNCLFLCLLKWQFKAGYAQVSGIESRYRRDDGHTGLTKSMLSNADSDSIDLMMVKNPVNQILLSHHGLIVTSDGASIAAVVSEAAVAFNQGSVRV